MRRNGEWASVVRQCLRALAEDPDGIAARTRRLGIAAQGPVVPLTKLRELDGGLSLRVDVTGKRVIVYDDVLTTGCQLDTIARFLKAHGAASVRGLVLARAPWRPR